MTSSRPRYSLLLPDEATEAQEKSQTGVMDKPGFWIWACQTTKPKPFYLSWHLSREERKADS